MLSQEEKAQIRKTADSGVLELIKKDILEMEYQMFLGMKTTKDKDKIFEILTTIQALDNIMRRFDSYKTVIEKEDIGQDGRVTKINNINEDYKNIMEWYKDKFIKSFNI
jgi:hypothetical protein